MPRKVRPLRFDGDIAYVPLTQGYEAIIDAEDAPLVCAWNWCARLSRRPDGSISKVYAKRKATVNGQAIALEMHRVIAATPDGMETDHRDGDGLNNRKSNLRNASVMQNRQNCKTRVDNRSGVKGVHWCETRQRWLARIKTFGRSKYLGAFMNLDEAAGAYRRASVEMHGEFGRLE